MAILDPAKNFGKVTVSTGYDNAALSVVLTAGFGASLPQPSTDGSFNLTWWNSTDYADPSDDPNKEVVRCTARSTDTLTILRAQENTSASTKNTGGKTYKMLLTVTAKTISDLNTALATFPLKSNNLSDMTPATMRTNLGLGSLATQSGTFSGSSSGSNTGDQTISDATISTTDITTNNVSTTKHGFMPKLPNDVTKVFRGDGTYGTVSGGLNWYNVKSYGATGNGSTDDTTALKAAQAAAVAGGGGVVYAPTGTYKITDSITMAAGVSWRGDGMKATFISQFTATKDAFKNANIAELDFEIDIAEIGFIGTATGSLPAVGASIGTATISNANPAVVSKTAHGLASGDVIYFTTTGTLPADNTTGAPLKPNWPYFVIAAGLTVNAFEISETFGGTAIHTTSAGSGTHTLWKMACGINLNGVPLDYISIRNVSCEAFNGCGIYLGGPIASYLDKVISTGNVLDGIVIDGLSSATTSVTMRGCYGNANNNVGIRVNQATYLNWSGCAADSNKIGYYLLDVAGVSLNGCGAEENTQYSFMVDGINWGTQGAVLNGCFALDSGTTGFYITGVSTGVVLVGCTEEGTSTNALVVDSSASVKVISPSFANAVSATGQLSIQGKTVAAAATTGTFSQPMIYETITITPTGSLQMNATSGFPGARTSIIVTTSGTSTDTITFGTNFKSTGTLASGIVSGKVFTVNFVCKDGTTWCEESRTTAM